MSARLVGSCPQGAVLVLWVLVATVLLGGCATGTGPLHGRLTSGFGLHSRSASFRFRSALAPAGEPLRVVLEERAETPWEDMPEGFAAGPPTCGGQPLPTGWPQLSSDTGDALLAPLLACTPAEFVEVQRHVDMPRLVEALDDWSAVRLGALGPVRDDAAEILNRKRASFLVQLVQERGPAEGEVFTLFLIRRAFDDELKAMLALLAEDKRLGETLGRMDAAREVLARRGVRLSDYKDRSERPLEDGARGALTALDEAFTTQTARNARATRFTTQRGHLPPAYQQALDEVERVGRLQSWSPGNVARGVFDELTLGIPLGVYGAATGLGHGVHALSEGRYEQAAHELTPAALMVALYAGGKGVRYASEARGAPRLQPLELRAKLVEVVTHLEARLGGDALGELARYIQANREAGRFVAVGGPEAAIALHEARGDVARAHVWLSEAKRPKAPGEAAALGKEAVGSTLKTAKAGTLPAGLSSLVDTKVGLTVEVVEAKLVQVELDSAGPRLSGNVAMLEKQLASLKEAPPAGATSHPLWSEYVRYGEGRLAELTKGIPVEPPLLWEGYQRMRGNFARGLAFERAFVEVLRADAALPKAQRRFLGDFDSPRIEMYVGVKKPSTGLRFADVLIIEESQLAGPLPRVETFSFKSRNLSSLKRSEVISQMTADASEALKYYGENVEIRRPSLELQGREVPVHRVRLIYEGGTLKPNDTNALRDAMKEAEKKVQGVEVLVQ